MLHFRSMRATLVALLACMIAHQSHAQVILLSESRSVSVSGFAQGYGAERQSYSQTQTPSAPFASFNGSVSGSADSTDAFPAFPLDSLWTYHADGQSSQTSAITPSEIAVSGRLHGDEWIGFNTPSGGPPHGASSSMSSVFEVSFRIDTPIEYNLSSGPLLKLHIDDPSNGSDMFDFSLTSANHGVILNYSDFLWASFFGSSSGILQPDDYTLRLNVSASLVADPLGDLADADYSVRFAATPESAPTALLLGMTFAGLAALRRRIARLRR